MMGAGQVNFLLLGLGQSSLVWVWKISPLKIPNFCPSGQKKLLEVKTKSTWVKDRSAFYLLLVKSTWVKDRSAFYLLLVKSMHGLGYGS